MHAVKQLPTAQNHCKGFTKGTDEVVNKMLAEYLYSQLLQKGIIFNIYWKRVHEKIRLTMKAG